MTDDGFDPFLGAETARSEEEAAALASAFAEQSSDWEPISGEGEGWGAAGDIGDLESLMLDEGVGKGSRVTLGSGVFHTPVHHNPLPDEFGLPTQAGQFEDELQTAYNSNEAILQSGAVRAEKRTASATREALPSRSDAPFNPVVVESRPLALVLPGIVLLGGVGAGVYVLACANPILGGIAIALSLVGGLFLRVLLKQ